MTRQNKEVNNLTLVLDMFLNNTDVIQIPSVKLRDLLKITFLSPQPVSINVTPEYLFVMRHCKADIAFLKSSLAQSYAQLST